MESPFKCDNPNACAMTFDELRDLIEMVDVGAYFSFIHCVPEGDRTRQGMIEYLMAHEPFLFHLAESITESYQNAYFIAVRQRDRLIESYIALKAATNTVESLQPTTFVRELEKQVQIQKPATAKKRAREKKNQQEEQIDHDNELTCTKKVLKMSQITENKFYAQEKFSGDFGFEKYVHVVPKGKTRKDLSMLKNSVGWETIYHCNGPWQAEQLVEELKLEGRKCLIIKRARGGMDQEVLSYKVIASEK